jgi:hypothetical protein
MNTKLLGSFVLVLIMGIVGNQVFIRAMQPEGGDREIANIFDRNSSEQMNWERQRALEISKSDLISQSQAPSWVDKLAFEYLAGKYNLKVAKGQISTIELKDNVLGQRFDTQEFLDKFGLELSPFTNFKITHIDSNIEVADLFNQQGARVSTIRIIRDSDSRVTKISVE